VTGKKQEAKTSEEKVSEGDKLATEEATESSVELKTCFVIMPISDVDGYEPGHFRRVFDLLIKPAARVAGFDAMLANSTSSSHLIMADVIKKCVKSDLVIADLSSRNPNVLYELGIRQAFDKPTVLICDKVTDRIFDVSGLRTTYYHRSLRADLVRKEVGELAKAVRNTMDADPDEINSMIRLLNVTAAPEPARTEVSAETAMLLREMRELRTLLPSANGRTFEKDLEELEKVWDAIGDVSESLNGYHSHHDYWFSTPPSDEEDAVERQAKLESLEMMIEEADAELKRLREWEQRLKRRLMVP
jgi:hypothetical protein